MDNVVEVFNVSFCFFLSAADVVEAADAAIAAILTAVLTGVSDQLSTSTFVFIDDSNFSIVLARTSFDAVDRDTGVDVTEAIFRLP